MKERQSLENSGPGVGAAPVAKPLDEHRKRRWGHLGVKTAAAKKSIWYPVDDLQAERIRSALVRRSVGEADPWIAIVTLNNRVVALHLPHLKRVTLLANDGEPQSADPVQGFDVEHGFPTVVYSALEAAYDGFDLLQTDTPTDVRRAVELMAAERWSDKVVASRLRETHIHYTDGTRDSAEIDGEAIAEIYARVCGSGLIDALDLSDVSESQFSSVSANFLALVDMPWHYMHQAGDDLFVEVLFSPPGSDDVTH